MTDTTFTHTALIEAAEKAGVTPDQARTILEAAGVKVQPEKPEPGTWHIARPDSDRLPAFVTKEGRLLVFEDGYIREDHAPDGKWPELAPARVVPVTAAQVTLTEDQMGEVWDAVTASDPGASIWADYPSSHRARFKAVVTAILDQYAAPAEGVPA